MPILTGSGSVRISKRMFYPRFTEPIYEDWFENRRGHVDPKETHTPKRLSQKSIPLKDRKEYRKMRKGDIAQNQIFAVFAFFSFAAFAWSFYSFETASSAPNSLCVLSELSPPYNRRGLRGCAFKWRRRCACIKKTPMKQAVAHTWILYRTTMKKFKKQ